MPILDVFSLFGGKADNVAPQPTNAPQPSTATAAAGDAFSAFGGKADAQPSAIASPDAFAQFGGKADPPSLWQRVKNAVIGPGTFASTHDAGDTWSSLVHHPVTYLENAPHYFRDYVTKPFVNVSAAMTPQEQANHPILAGAADVATGLTTPANVGLIGASGGLGAFAEGLAGKTGAQLTARLAAGGFAASSLPGLVKTAKDYVAALQSGDTETAQRLATSGVLQSALAFLGGHYAATGEPLIPAKGNVHVATSDGHVWEGPASGVAEVKNLDPSAVVVRETPAEAPTASADNSAVTEPSKTLSPRGKTTVEQISQAASFLGMTPQDVFERMPAEGASAEEIVNGTQILQDKIAGLKPTITNADLTTPEGRAAALDAVNDFLKTQDQVRGKLHSEAGRALRATQINNGENRNFSQALTALDTLSDDKKAAALVGMQKLLQSGDDGAFAKFASDIKPSSTMDKLHEAWLNSILSGAAVPKKTFGDFAMALTTPFEKTLSSGPNAAAQYVRGQIAAIPDAFTTAWKVFGEDMSTLDEVETARGGIKNRAPAIKGTTGAVIRTPGRALAAVSSFFHTVHYDGSLWEQAFKQAQSEGFTGDELSQRAAELRQSPTPAMRERAYEESSTRTYQGKLGAAGEFLAKAPNVPGIRKVVPFARVPLNILKVSTELSPFGFLKTGIKAATNSEFRGSPEMATELARNTIGGMLSLWAYYLGHSGLMTGAPTGNTDRDVQDKPSYSVRIGNHWVSYRYATPLALALAAGAGAGNSERENPGNKAADLGNALKSSTKALGGIPLIESLNYLVQGFTNAVKDYAAGKSESTTAAKFATEQATSAIPQGVANLAAWMDSSQRAPQNWLDEFKQRLPLLREQVAPKLGPDGKPLPAIGNLGGFSPITVEDVNQDPVIAEMARLHIPVPKPIVTVDDANGNPIAVTPAEAQQLQAHEDDEFYKDTMQLMSNPEWKSWTPQFQQQNLRSIRAGITQERYPNLLDIRAREHGTSGLAGTR
jgi:hypothetical protein